MADSTWDWGAGYVREEFEAAELPFPTAGQRVAHLEHVTTHLRHQHPSIPLLIAGNGDRVLTLAAQQAQIIASPEPTSAKASPTRFSRESSPYGLPPVPGSASSNST